MTLLYRDCSWGFSHATPVLPSSSDFDFKSKTMRTHAALRSEEASEAAWSGGRGAVVGAAKVCLSLSTEISNGY